MKNNILTKKMKQRLKRVIIGLILLLILVGLELFGFFEFLEGKLGIGNTQNIQLVISLLIYFAAGHYILKKALNNLKKGQWMDEIFLMTVASLGAFFLGEYHEAIAVVLFYEIGEFFQDYAVKKSRKSITELMDVRPVYANLKTGDTYKKINPTEVKVGDVLIIMPGEKIPVDGIVVKGESSIDKRAMTGESVPDEVNVGDAVVSGCINLNSVLEMKATALYADSTVAKVLALMQTQGANKAKAEEFISKFAKYYTPAVVILAVLIALVPALTFDKGNFSTWVYSALTFLVISCPCALVLSVPLSFFGGIGGASANGILIKGAGFIEAISKIDTIIFDKTGTLTKGSFEVVKVEAESDKDEVLRLAAACEQYSTHPVAVSIYNSVKKEDLVTVNEVKELSGLGISAEYEGERVLIGNKKLMLENSVEIPGFDVEDKVCTKVYVAKGGKCIGIIFVADAIKPNANNALKLLRKYGISNMIMLSGDRRPVAEHVAKELGIDEVYAELLPGDKVEITNKVLAAKANGKKTAYVGDGINDAPVLAGVDVGISFGGIGSDAAVEASDVVIMNDDLEKIPLALKLAGKTMTIVKENIVFAILIKVLVLILSACGLISMWLAVIADVGVCLIAVLNSIRTIGFKKE